VQSWIDCPDSDRGNGDVLNGKPFLVRWVLGDGGDRLFLFAMKYQGIILHCEGKLTRVLFKTEEGPMEYMFPTKILKKAGIYVKNQPFEIDGLDVRALAPASSAKIEKLQLPEEYQKKYDRIMEWLEKKDL
jgi:hypothetical protein